MYTSELIKSTPIYHRECENGNYHYQTVEVNVKQSGTYGFDDINRLTEMYGYIYKDIFDPFNPNTNLLSESNFRCSKNPFRFTAYLEVNKTYILVLTTLNPYTQGNFTIAVTGSNNITFNHISKYFNLQKQNFDKPRSFKTNCITVPVNTDRIVRPENLNYLFLVKSYSSCVIGDYCHSFTKGIGLTLDDILRNEIQEKKPVTYQSSLIKIAATLTMLMFVGGLINSICSLLTFQNKTLRQAHSLFVL